MKVFYQSPVSHSWIRQRPHFVAEGLAKCGCEVFWFHTGAVGKCKFRKWDNGNGWRGLELPVLPFASRFRFIDRLNSLWISFWLRHERCDCLLATYPMTYLQLPKHVRNVATVYDCMDVYSGFERGRRLLLLQEREQEIVNHSTRIIVSSKHIGTLLVERYGADSGNISVITNGLDMHFSVKSLASLRKRKQPSIAYFGTVGRWFDWETIAACAELAPEVSFDIFGPIECNVEKLPKNIHFYGAISHDEVYGEMSASAVLMMPFIRNELIEGVDPVKMYEYLSTGRPIISSWWPMLEKFRDFDAVNFYHDLESFRATLSRVLQEDKSYEIPRSFLDDSSWTVKLREFIEVLMV